MLGKEVVTLVNERLAAGVYPVQWDAVNQPSGNYFYKLATPNAVQTRKMLVLK
jgi:hypothetical protein